MNTKGSARRGYRLRNLRLLVAMPLIVSSCVLMEGSTYALVSQGHGVTAVIKVGLTEQLLISSDVVSYGVNIDGVLKDRNINTTCPKLGGRYNGDLCAFRILGSIETTGRLASIINYGWRKATAMDEFEDFRKDSMEWSRVAVQGCIAVSLYPTGENWTTRPNGKDGCK